LRLEGYRKLLVARDGGWKSILLRAAMWLPSLGYAAAMRVRSFCYNRGLLKVHKAAVPVICIGNITTGGTGKTPLVIWLAEVLRQRGLRCAILTRGYKTRKGRLSDEPAILTKSCPDAKVVVNADRVAGAKKAVEEYGAQVLVMDDGFQHRRLARDLDIVAVDATCPFGGAHVLPAGLLREPMKAFKRAGAVVMTRSNQASALHVHLAEERIRSINPNAAIARSVHVPVGVKMLKGMSLAVESLKGQNVYAFCGIGNPDGFFGMLEQMGVQLVGKRVYDDHYDYSVEDIKGICQAAAEVGADVVLTTQKDWAKTALGASHEGGEGIVLGYLDIRLEITDGTDRIMELIDRVVSRPLT